jgi:hypothetical protein
MTDIPDSAPPSDVSGTPAVGGPVSRPWREGTLTRAKELQSLRDWALRNNPRPNSRNLAEAIYYHLEAAREAAKYERPRFRWFRGSSNASLLERAISNLDAAEAHLLNLAPPDYVLGQMSSLLNHVQRHLAPTDPRRQELERIAQKLGVKNPNSPMLNQNKELRLRQKVREVNGQRGRIVTAVRGASSAALREQLRLRSFRNVVVVTVIAMTVLAGLVALMGAINPTLAPLCFLPEETAKVRVVCPTAQSGPFSTGPESPPIDRNKEVKKIAGRADLLVVELIGLAAAAVAAATAIRGIRGSSEHFGLPVALAVLKLPMGAVTAFLGLLLMRGQFVPGLTALDTPAQILAWALIFGYAQQLFTRLVDQQGQTVLDAVRGADKHEPSPAPS